MSRFRYWLILLALLLFQGCTSSKGDPYTVDPFEGVPVLEVGEPLDITDEQAAESGRFYFTSTYFRDMSIDRDGHLFVENSGSATILHFDENGVFQEAIGSEGEGPGEFQTGVLFDIPMRDSLYALDARSMRVNLFTRSDEKWRFSDAFNLEQKEGYRIQNIYPLASDRLLLDYATDLGQMLALADQDTQFTRVLELRTASGDMIDDFFLNVQDEEQFIFSTNRGGVLNTLPYGAPSIFDIGPNNLIYYLYGSDFRIQIYDANGTLTDSIVHPTYKAEITDELKKAEQENLGVGMGDPQLQREMEQQYVEEIPSYGAALRDMHVDRDNGQVIVRRHTFDGEPNWMLLDRDGSRLGSFRLDEDMQVFDFRGGTILGSVRNDEVLPTMRVVNLPG